MGNRTKNILFLVACLSYQSCVCAYEITTGIDESATLKFWQVSGKDMNLRFVQRLPDQTRGFFLARGFNLKQVDDIANSCVFQTVFKNISQGHNASSLEYNLLDWQVILPGQTKHLKTREVWKQEWVRRGISTSAKIAFEWSLLPTHQVYRPGDYNWGMSVFDLMPGTVFDLKVVWKQHGKMHQAVIHKLRCAKDSDVQQQGSK